MAPTIRPKTSAAAPEERAVLKAVRASGFEA
jgi:hypothetical protein